MRLRVGTVMVLLALVPMIGLTGLAFVQALDIAETRRDLNTVEAATADLLVLVELEVAVIDEVYWTEAQSTTGQFGIPPGFITAAYGFDLEARVEDARGRVDTLLNEVGDTQLALALNSARRQENTSIRSSPIDEFARTVLRPLVAARTTEVIQLAATVDGSRDLVRSTQVLEQSNVLRFTFVDLVSQFFFVVAFGPGDDNAALRQLIDTKELYDQRSTELTQIIVDDTDSAAAWRELRINESRIAVLAEVDELSTSVRLQPVIGDDEINPAGLDQLAAGFGNSDEAFNAHLMFLDDAAADVNTEVTSRRARADGRTTLIGGLVLVVTMVTLAGAFVGIRSIVQPLADLSAAADLLRTGDNSASFSVRGPTEVRTVAATLNEAVENLRRAELQALALADGRLDDLTEDDKASGTLGSSLATAVERLRVSLGEREEYRRRLAHEASHDGLTGVPNRSASLEHLGGALARAERVETDVAVLFVDLDNFKQVNDSRGHAAGDRLLREISKRLIRSCRDGDLVGRIGGDEFLVIAEPVVDEAEARQLSERLLDAVCAPFDDGEGVTTPSVSIGAALAGGRRQASEVIHDADLAVYEAKEAGRGQTAFCDDEMRSRLLADADLESAIRNGLESDEFELHFQPTFNLETGVLDGAEALLRWDRKGYGQIRPERFIQFAERTDLISEIDSWVMKRALTHLAAWAGDDALQPLHLAVNVSGRHLLRGDLTREVTSALAETGADPSKLTVEVTESALLDDFTTAGEHLAALRERGIQVAIDDFGTGYTSLSHLRQLPVDILKVDRTFTSNLHRSDDLSLVKLVIETGHLLGHTVTVEGVEGLEQERILRGLGADRLQGYRFGRPMTEHDLRVHLTNPARVPIDVAPLMNSEARTDADTPIDSADIR